MIRHSFTFDERRDVIKLENLIFEPRIKYDSEYKRLPYGSHLRSKDHRLTLEIDFFLPSFLNSRSIMLPSAQVNSDQLDRGKCCSIQEKQMAYIWELLLDIALQWSKNTMGRKYANQILHKRIEKIRNEKTINKWIVPLLWTAFCGAAPVPFLQALSGQTSCDIAHPLWLSRCDAPCGGERRLLASRADLRKIGPACGPFASLHGLF